MKILDNTDMAAMIEYWRSVVPKRPLTYGMNIKYGREQAHLVRAFADQNQPAVNLLWLFKQTVIPVHRVPSYVLSEHSGLNTRLVDGQLQIFINANEPYLRQRFSALHELKHALDFPDHPILYQNLGQGNEEIRHDQIEAIANDFAAHVLMPADFIERVWSDTHDIFRTAETFKASVEATARRLENLGLIGEIPPIPSGDDAFWRATGPNTESSSYLACV